MAHENEKIIVRLTHTLRYLGVCKEPVEAYLLYRALMVYWEKNE